MLGSIFVLGALGIVFIVICLGAFPSLPDSNQPAPTAQRNADQEREQQIRNTRNTGATSATVLSSRIVPFQGATVPNLQMVMTTWKNTGTTPIRAIDATFTFRDSNGQVIETIDYTLYAVFTNSSAGVAPGEIYTTPKGDGFVVSPTIGRPTTVEVTPIKVLEWVKDP